MTLTNQHIDLLQFDKDWTTLGREICREIYAKPEIQKLKNHLAKNGFLTLEEKSLFIDLCDGIKYEMIYGRFGPAESEGYKQFSKSWQEWFQSKGVISQKDRSQRSSVDHILFGSTPDPEQFLLRFEEEILGSMKPTE